MKSITTFCLIALLFLSACERPLSSREKGVLVGGAIGSGAGAIIGHATGKTGAGVAIGGALGALSGGLIGNESDVQEKRQEDQDERLRRQEEELRRQRREIEELRRDGGRDSAPRRYDDTSKDSGYSY